jgi:hypothetical protein
MTRPSATHTASLSIQGEPRPSPIGRLSSLLLCATRRRAAQASQAAPFEKCSTLEVTRDAPPGCFAPIDQDVRYDNKA